MSATALSRLLEAVAKSIKHGTAMSTILSTELFQARSSLESIFYFAKFYLRDMSQLAANLQTLGPAVVAQKVVGVSRIELLTPKEDWQLPKLQYIY